MTQILKSFQLTFVSLIAITVLTALRSLNNNLTNIEQLSLQLSTFITTTASLYYYLIIIIPEHTILYRYLDWFITTPVLLIDLILVLEIYELNFMIEIIVLNTIMLIFGLMGELHIITNINSTIFGFIPFIYMFYRIYERITKQNTKQAVEKYNLFYFFLIMWSLYGFAHMIKDYNNQTLVYNNLDLITKGAFGIYLFYRTIKL